MNQQAGFSKNHPQIDITYSAKYLSCKSPTCLICLTGKGHGPYWYASFSYNGKSHNIFLGDKFEPLDIQSVLTKIDADQKRYSTKKQKTANHWNTEKLSRKFKVSATREKYRTPDFSTTYTKEPTQADFETDISQLSRTQHPERLKSIYRQLIKKYHPDQYCGNLQMNHWMAEINSTYREQRLKVKSAV